MKLAIAYCVITWTCVAVIAFGPPGVNYAGLLGLIAVNAVVLAVAMWRSASGRKPTPPPSYTDRAFARRSARAARRASVVIDREPRDH